jgi:hypothetical protein
LLWIAHAINENVLEFAADYVQSYQPLISVENIVIENSKEKVALIFLEILRDLKNIADNANAVEGNDVSRLRDEFNSIAE